MSTETHGEGNSFENFLFFFHRHTAERVPLVARQQKIQAKLQIERYVSTIEKELAFCWKTI